MEFTTEFFAEFIDQLIVLDKDCTARLDAACQMLRKRDQEESDERKAAYDEEQQQTKAKARRITSDMEKAWSKSGCISASQLSGAQFEDDLAAAAAEIAGAADRLAARRRESMAKTARLETEWRAELRKRLDTLTNAFLSRFPPRDLRAEYDRIYGLEPAWEGYACCDELPRSVYLNTLEYDLTDLTLGEYTKNFLRLHYFFLCRNGRFIVPLCTPFGAPFNCLLRFRGEGRFHAVKTACDLGMRLFMMLPPGKVNFTFADPVTLGESFAMFTRLVDVDDRSSEVINGKIWSNPTDIENKLKIMTDHISNVTQRYLQGKYESIYAYNQAAEQNAEPYQVLMLMDFPAGLTEQSLKYLEQIVTSGPKCGVFTLLFRSEEQYAKSAERLRPFIDSIEGSFTALDCADNGDIHVTDKALKGRLPLWRSVSLPDDEKMNVIIDTIRKGIKSADKVVIDIEKVSGAETSDSTKDGIRIPIGIHGANEVQYLTLGVGGSHHALIAGVAGSGKSSLLHTIILRALTQYNPDELSIYLVDFKRGVEFKIYADFILPAFKVVAIESEREFGCNILAALEREQKIRADLFKKNHVDKIEEYRALGKKMPRILVIMDEFHELFSGGGDALSKNAAIIMERIVRQGRAFGVHMILASQSYSNITGIDRAVFDQMSVRIVLKCSRADANLLLDNGSSEIDQISIDDPGRAVYNSEAGNREYNSHFRVAYIDPSRHREMLQEISNKTKSYADSKHPTRILLSNIEDNNYSIFNQFTALQLEDCPAAERLYIGEPLSLSGDMEMDFFRQEYSNLLFCGSNTEKARDMFTFAILSLCVDHWIKFRQPPERPFITLYNCKPLQDSYFKDMPQVLSQLLPEYVQYVDSGSTNGIRETLSDFYDSVSGAGEPEHRARYFFVFGYQRAEELKSEAQMSQSEDIDSLFNITHSGGTPSSLSNKEMFRHVVSEGGQQGVHTVLWQDSFSALYQYDKDIMSYFALRVAFDMSLEEYSRFVGTNDVSMLGDNNAIYFNKMRDNQIFRPYQTPDEEWLKGICDKLK